MVSGSEDPVEIFSGEISGQTVTVAKISRDMAAVSGIVCGVSNKLSVTRTLHYVYAPIQGHAQTVVEVGVVDAMYVGRLVATTAITWMSKQPSFVATNSHGHRRCRQATGSKETVPGVRQRATGFRHLPSAHIPSKVTPSVRSTADFWPDLD